MSKNQETQAHLVLVQLSVMRLIADPVQEISQVNRKSRIGIASMRLDSPNRI
jgi:hypothetical protein